MDIRCPKCGGILEPGDIVPETRDLKCPSCGSEDSFIECILKTTRLKCQSCGKAVVAGEVTPEDDRIECQGCGQVSILSDKICELEAIDLDLENPPEGAWFVNTEDGFRAGATTRFKGVVWGAVVMIIATGFITLAFIAFLMSENALFGVILCATLFYPLLAYFWIVTVLMIWGKVEIVSRGSRLTIFAGIGSIGWKKELDAGEITGVCQRATKWHGYGIHDYQIVLEGRRKTSFGSMVETRRRMFLFSVILKKVLHKQKSDIVSMS